MKRLFWNIRRICCYLFRIPIGLTDMNNREICAGDKIKDGFNCRIVKRDDFELSEYNKPNGKDYKINYWCSERLPDGKGLYYADWNELWAKKCVIIGHYASFKEYMTLRS